MAEKKEAPEGEAAPAKSKKKLLMFIIIGVVVLVLVVGGALAFLMMGKKKAADEEAGDEEQTEEVDKKKGKDKKDGHAALPTFYKFDKPFTVRLAPGDAGEENFLQIEAQFKLLDPTGVDAVKANEAELKHRITLLLLARKASDLTTAKGVEELAWAIRDAANHTLHPPKKKKGAADDHADTKPSEEVDADAPVQAVLFTTFIIQ